MRASTCAMVFAVLELAACGGDDAGAPAVEVDVPCTEVEDNAGDVVITSAADWEAFVASGCTSIRGSLSIDGIDDVNLPSVPKLKTVASYVEVQDNANLTSLNLPHLQSALWIDVQDNRALATVDLSSVATTGDDLRLRGNNALVSLSLPSLNAVGGDLTIADAQALTTIDAPGLTSVGFEVLVENLPALTTLNLSSLENIIGGFEFYATGLDVLELPALTDASGISVASNATLSDIRFPVLSSLDSLSLTVNRALLDFSIPALESLQSLNIYENRVLPSCLVTAFTDRITVGISPLIYLNDDTGTCD